MGTDTFTFLFAFINYCKYLVKFTTVTVSLVDPPESHVISASKFVLVQTTLILVCNQTDENKIHIHVTNSAGVTKYLRGQGAST
jgi:hypothetical protein